MPHIVVARSAQSLEWLAELPERWRVTVVDTAASPDDREAWPGVRWHTAPAHVDGDTVMAHAVTTLLDDGAAPDDLTVFAPADPFELSPDLLTLLEHAEHFGEVQPLAARDRLGHEPCERDRRDWIGELPVRAERFSLDTLAPLGSADDTALRAGRAYRRKHGLADGQPLMAHFLALAGLEDLAAQAAQADIGCHVPGPIFAVRARALAQARMRLRPLLPAWRVLARADRNYPALLDLCWLHLFGLPFHTLPGLAGAPAAAACASPAMTRVVASIDAVLARAAATRPVAALKPQDLPILTSVAPGVAPVATITVELQRERVAQALARGDQARAWSLLQDGLTRWPESAPLLADAMALAYRQCDTERALHCAQRLLAIEPDHLDALFTLGLCHATLGQPDAATAVLGRLSNHPDAAVWQDHHPEFGQALQALQGGTTPSPDPAPKEARTHDRQAA